MKLLHRLRRGFRYLWDILTLFNGVQTAGSLERTQGRRIRRRGLFLFRENKEK
ncbi:MAG: hypothetical protein WCE75_07475 [Terracidiphilus sp.]